MNNDQYQAIHKRLDHLEMYQATIGNKITVIESIISEDGTSELIETVKYLKRAVSGDPSIGLPPLYKTIENMKMYHSNLKVVIFGLAVVETLSIILALLALIT